MGYVEGETGSYSETCVTCDVDRTEGISIKVEETIDIKEEVSVKVEEAIYIKDEIPEAIAFPPIKTEHEVRLWGVCEVVAVHDFGPFIASKENCEITLNYFLLNVVMWVRYTFRNLDCNPEEKSLFGSHSH
jgi:hypothetical protein